MTDANGCPDSGPLTELYTITEPTALVIDTNIVQPTCDSTDGILYVTVTGGTVSSDYNYVWDDISTPEYNKSFDDSLLILELVIMLLLSQTTTCVVIV